MNFLFLLVQSLLKLLQSHSWGWSYAYRFIQLPQAFMANRPWGKPHKSIWNLLYKKLQTSVKSPLKLLNLAMNMFERSSQHVGELESFWATLLGQESQGQEHAETQGAEHVGESLNLLDVLGTLLVPWRHLGDIVVDQYHCEFCACCPWKETLTQVWFLRDWRPGFHPKQDGCHKVSLSFKCDQIDFSLCRTWWFLPSLPPSHHNQDGLDDGCGESETWSRESTWKSLTMNDLIFLHC